VAEHTLLRAFEAVQGVHDLLQLRQSLLEAEETPGTHAIQTHIEAIVAGGRFGIVQVGVTDRHGVGAWGTGGGAGGVSVADREYVRAHLDGGADGLFVSHPLLGRSTGRWGVQVSRPVRDLWGRLVGVGVVSLDPVALSRGLGRDLNGAAQVAVVPPPRMARCWPAVATWKLGSAGPASPTTRWSWPRAALPPAGSPSEASSTGVR
jgi:hypothetical protein